MTFKPRLPMEHMVVLYGAPPMPQQLPWHPDLAPPDQLPWQPEMFPVTPVPTDPGPNTTTGTKFEWPTTPKVADPKDVDWKAVEKALKEQREAADYTRVKSHVRVVARKESDGTVKLKVYIDGVLQSEVESDGSTLSAEFDL